MRIRCPFCGDRDSREFSYLGSTQGIPTRALSPAGPEEVFAAVYLRSNPAGPHEELWYHVYGCRLWLCVNRNTLTHEILSVRTAGQTDAP